MDHCSSSCRRSFDIVGLQEISHPDREIDDIEYQYQRRSQHDPSGPVQFGCGAYRHHYIPIGGIGDTLEAEQKNPGGDLHGL